MKLTHLIFLVPICLVPSLSRCLRWSSMRKARRGSSEDGQGRPTLGPASQRSVDLACALCRTGDDAGCLRHLGRALLYAEGVERPGHSAYHLMGRAAADPDLECVHRDQRFRQLEERYRCHPFDVDCGGPSPNCIHWQSTSQPAAEEVEQRR